eukprot:2933157-Rhodomonas_salina.1
MLSVSLLSTPATQTPASHQSTCLTSPLTVVRHSNISQLSGCPVTASMFLATYRAASTMVPPAALMKWNCGFRLVSLIAFVE